MDLVVFKRGLERQFNYRRFFKMGDHSKRILLSAFACEPGRGSEQEVGWKWAVELAKRPEIVDVIVLTQTRNRPGITSWLERPEYQNLPLRFEYVQFPEPIYRLKSRFDFLTMPYYAAWQWLALGKARELHAVRPFNLVHHLTFATFRIPIWMKRLGIPVVMGPVGGAERAPWALLRHRARPRVYLREALRNILTGFGILTLRLLPPLGREQGLCLATTPRMGQIFDSLGSACQLFPTIGVDMDTSPPALREEGAVARRFLFVGRLHFLKGLQLLLDAFARVEISGLELSLVGDGPEEIWLRRQAAELRIEDRVHFLGRIPREQLAEIYREHDVICGPSMYESGGLSVIEGMEHGLPAVVLDVGGHAVSVTCACGIKVVANGPAETAIAGLADALRRYASDSGLFREHSEAARSRVEEVYDWRVKVPRMVRTYDEVLGRRTKR